MTTHHPGEAVGLSGDGGPATLRRAADLVVDHLETVHRGPVTASGPSIAAVRAWLDSCDLEHGRPAEEVLEELATWLGASGVHTTHPRYFGLFNPRPTWPSIAGDVLAAGFNPQLAAHSHAAAAVELEARLLRLVGDRAGLPPGTHGSFTTGGAEANHSATLVALTAAFPGFGERGVEAARGRPVLYASQESHLAWLKIAHACGIGRDAVRLVPVDRAHRMDPGALEAMHDDDVARGHRPFLLVATAGTTGAGAIDPLDRLADIAVARDLHLHVDAAWAGALVLSDRLRGLLAGIERADTLTVDAHKWLSVPMGAGMVLTRDRSVVERTFGVTTSYMPAADESAPDPYTSSMQWSRRAIGAKVFAALATHGRLGYAAQLEHDVALGEHLATAAQERGWELVNDTPLPVVCLADPAPGPDAWAWHSAVADSVVRQGTAWVGPVRLAGRAAVRLCITNHRSSTADVEAALDALDQARARVGPA